MSEKTIGMLLSFTAGVILASSVAYFWSDEKIDSRDAEAEISTSSGKVRKTNGSNNARDQVAGEPDMATEIDPEVQTHSPVPASNRTPVKDPAPKPNLIPKHPYNKK